jgi:hypothetical protein
MFTEWLPNSWRLFNWTFFCTKCHLFYLKLETQRRCYNRSKKVSKIVPAVKFSTHLLPLKSCKHRKIKNNLVFLSGRTQKSFRIGLSGSSYNTHGGGNGNCMHNTTQLYWFVVHKLFMRKLSLPSCNSNVVIPMFGATKWDTITPLCYRPRPGYLSNMYYKMPKLLKHFLEKIATWW